MSCVLHVPVASGETDDQEIQRFVRTHCVDCHEGQQAEAQRDLARMSIQLDDAANFATWERIFDRVRLGEMPPRDADQPTKQRRREFMSVLSDQLNEAHTKVKGTVLRRLNRREYENTLNDIFGTDLDLAGMLPADGRSHEFDNVGEALSISMVQLQKYMEAGGAVLDAAIAKTTAAPEPKLVKANYKDTREGQQFIGKRWKELPDGAVVRFSGGGYPTGMMRSANVRQRGRYRIQVTGYAYQSKAPMIFSVGGTSFARGSEKPIFGFFSFPPDQSTTVEFHAFLEKNYMIQIEPFGIADPRRYQRGSIADYEGPGLAIKSVVLEGPLIDEFPSRGHRLLFDGVQRTEIPPRNPAERKRRNYVPKFKVETDDELASASDAILRVATAAFRRPVPRDQVRGFVDLFQRERETGGSYEEALRTAVMAVLCSPRFIYMQEEPGTLDAFALATRLSYFLTRTRPDSQLWSRAADGSLLQPDVLRSETERLLDHPHAMRFIVDFTDAWLNLRDIDFTVPDRKLFPEFDQYLRYSMLKETRSYFRHLINADLNVTHLVKSDFAMLNSRLAEHYGLPAVSGAELKKTTLPPASLRGGILTQASVLKVSANGTNTSPVVRGVWVLERILGQSPPPPPPGVPGVEPDTRGAQTLRELLDKHRNADNCRACHRRIDPPGFALEEFDPVGGHRDRFRTMGREGQRVDKQILGRRVSYRLGSEVDSSGVTEDGRPFDGYRQFRDHLASDPDRLATTLAKKLLTFSTGRELGFSDRVEIERIVQQSSRKGHGVRELIHLVITSEIFRSK